MPIPLRTLFSDDPCNAKAKIIAIYTLLLTFNLAAWCWAPAAFHRFPVLVGTAFLASSFGLRHAVDADHIASRNPAADFKPRDILAEARIENRARVNDQELPKLLAKTDDYTNGKQSRVLP